MQYLAPFLVVTYTPCDDEWADKMLTTPKTGKAGF
jgi:hypothetical protein